MRFVLVLLVLTLVLWAFRRPVLAAVVRLTGTSVVSAEPVPGARTDASSPGPHRETP